MNTASDIRSLFPSLQRTYNGKPLIYMDGPGGTQIPSTVMQKMNAYYENSNTNIHGYFPTSIETDAVIHDARMSMAEFLNAEGPETISFGQNMTSLNYSLSKAIARSLQPGDEILITQLDHEANRGPWIGLMEYGVKVREVKLLNEGILDYDNFENKINENTKVVAVGCASNALGTVNDIKRIREKTYEFGSWLVLDAVHYAPHFKIDVQTLGCDFLFCSAYKFYGPHVGILYSKPGLLDSLTTDCLRTQEQVAPYKIETGTLNHAALSGVTAAIDFIASMGEGVDRRSRIMDAMNNLADQENTLAVRLYDGLSSIPGISVVGVPFGSDQRAPTISIKGDNFRPEELCKYLGEEGICAWDGHFYAIRAIEVLGLLEDGGVTRFGISAYTTSDEVDKVIEAVSNFVSR